MSKKQTAVQWLTDKIVEILGDKCNELTQEQTLANHYAIKKAIQMEREQIEEAYNEANIDWLGFQNGSEYYTQTYE